MRALVAVFLFLSSFGVYAEAVEVHGFEAKLSHLARDEMAIVDRLARLREATERLPSDWKSSMKVDGQILHKQGLLFEIQEMEISAASRWELLLQNLASMNKPNSELSALEKSNREELGKLISLHQRINLKLDRFNAQLKEGILLNLARQIEKSPTQDD